MNQHESHDENLTLELARQKLSDVRWKLHKAIEECRRVENKWRRYDEEFLHEYDFEEIRDWCKSAYSSAREDTRRVSGQNQNS